MSSSGTPKISQHLGDQGHFHISNFCIFLHRLWKVFICFPGLNASCLTPTKKRWGSSCFLFWSFSTFSFYSFLLIYNDLREDGADFSKSYHAHLKMPGILMAVLGFSGVKLHLWGCAHFLPSLLSLVGQICWTQIIYIHQSETNQ